nr:hypothetical protein [Tanacetum cinerariifolium]
SIRVKGRRPIGIRGCASWDLSKGTWGVGGVYRNDLKRVAYPVVANYVRNTFGKYGLDPDVNLLKEDVINVPVWVKLHSVPVTKFSEDGLSVIDTKLGTPLIVDSYTSDMCMKSWGRSSYARGMIELWDDVEHACCKVFGHIQDECPKNLGWDVAKKSKIPSQSPRDVPVGTKVAFKPVKQLYILVSKYNYATLVEMRSSSISTTHVVDKINKIKNLIIDKKFKLVDDEGKPLIEVDYSGDHDSEDEVASVDNDMAIFLALEKVGYDQFEEEVAKAMREPTMEEFMNVTRINYESENKKGRIKLKGDYEEVLTNEELSNTEEENLTVENEIAQIFRIDTDLFHFKTPLSKAFEKFIYLSQIDADVSAIWPTCNWKEDGYRNTRDLPRFIREGNSICYEDYEWYDTIEDSKLKEETLINKAILEESMNVREESSNEAWSHYSPIDEWKDYGHTTYIETDSSSNQNTYNNVFQIIIDHCETQEKQGWFDEHELMEDGDDDIDDLEDYLIQKDPPY